MAAKMPAAIGNWQMSEIKFKSRREDASFVPLFEALENGIQRELSIQQLRQMLELLALAPVKFASQPR